MSDTEENNYNGISTLTWFERFVKHQKQLYGISSGEYNVSYFIIVCYY